VKRKILVRDYVKVMSVPNPWEGSGESVRDRYSWVGHVGIVIEIDYQEDDNSSTALVRFPSHCNENETGQRNIEFSVLRVVSRPKRMITRNSFDNSPPT
jgi:hypothetical protein